MITTQTFQCHGCDSKIENPEKFRCKIQIPFDEIEGFSSSRLVYGMGCVVFKDKPKMTPDWKLVSETKEN